MRYSIAFAASVLCLLCSATLAGQAPADASAGQAPGTERIDSLEVLLARLAQLEGMTARYREEKHVALLRQPLHSEGRVAFAAPDLLLRRVEQPERATMLLRGQSLELADAAGTKRLELSQHPALRSLVLTFVYVLSGNRKALERIYTLRFERTEARDGRPAGWRLELAPKDAALARIVERASVVGHGLVVEHMTLRETSGDSTRLIFSDVDLGVRYDAAARARVFRLEAPAGAQNRR